MSDFASAAAGQGTAINLSLVSHTNAGKTTLVRTLLGQDVGEVRDAAHVTDEATPYVLLQDGGDTLLLWDTPGFGDTARLLKRLKLSRNPLGWFLTQVWTGSASGRSGPASRRCVTRATTPTSSSIW
jgi:GTP-binding protein EngB required for normal cell division